MTVERLGPVESADIIDTSRNATIARIRAALRKRSGKAWSVTGGRGTAYGWITIDTSPARRTWVFVSDGRLMVNSGRPGGHMSRAEQQELGSLLGLGPVHFQGVNIAPYSDSRIEYIDRAEGRKPRVIGAHDWD